MSESLSWEKWSSFSSSPHKKYVEEAERYAQPGSVAQKKAFFEAHYKRIAAQKAAAALLEQQNAAAQNDDNNCAKAEIAVGIDNNEDADQEKRVILDSQFDVVEKIEDVNEDGGVNGNNQFSVGVVEIIKEAESAITTEIEASGESPMRRISVGSEITGTPQMEMPLLKQHNSIATDDVSSAESKRKSSLSCLKSSIRPKPVTATATNTTPYFKKENNDVIIQSTTRKPNVDPTGNKRSSSTKSLRELINLVPIKEPDKEPVFAAKKGSTKTPKDCSTPGTTKGVSKNPAATPLTENRRMKTPIDPSAARGSKTSGPKWHILSAVSSKSVTAYRNKLQSPCLSTPFTLRTEERAAKRKQKLEEKFNANAVQKARQQNKLKVIQEKAGNELRKLSCTFCFKARPLPDFYKERETSVNQLKKTSSVARPPQTVVLGRNNSNKKQGNNISMPPAPPPPKLSKKKVANGGKVVTPLLRIAPENKSPNIQHSNK
ncbi:hypothetical protein PHJA_001552500 [Phtheirospermum japonicum]|uniref:TPX2 C-terminal domain-containing protein n=1 Tax=Phtheirospermum japonicum TaxID=374723 RepID=A0A830CI49_9LAMI|nr:hypothetical protein PHJA_001552500 [Phtheirospermum japonicum]